MSTILVLMLTDSINSCYHIKECPPPSDEAWKQPVFFHHSCNNSCNIINVISPPESLSSLELFGLLGKKKGRAQPMLTGTERGNTPGERILFHRSCLFPFPGHVFLFLLTVLMGTGRVVLSDWTAGPESPPVCWSVVGRKIQPSQPSQPTLPLTNRFTND